MTQPDLDKIASYQLCRGKTFREFEANMSGFMQAGFQPYGDLIVWGSRLVQAMVFRPTETEDD